jgi:hypothetical protein
LIQRSPAHTLITEEAAEGFKLGLVGSQDSTIQYGPQGLDVPTKMKLVLREFGSVVKTFLLKVFIDVRPKKYDNPYCRSEFSSNQISMQSHNGRQ